VGCRSNCRCFPQECRVTFCHDPHDMPLSVSLLERATDLAKREAAKREPA
jgi:hypothetical protein